MKIFKFVLDSVLPLTIVFILTLYVLVSITLVLAASKPLEPREPREPVIEQAQPLPSPEVEPAATLEVKPVNVVEQDNYEDKRCEAMILRRMKEDFIAARILDIKFGPWVSDRRAVEIECRGYGGLSKLNLEVDQSDSVWAWHNGKLVKHRDGNAKSKTQTVYVPVYVTTPDYTSGSSLGYTQYQRSNGSANLYGSRNTKYR